MKFRQLSNRTLSLKEKIPIQRLFELCRIGSYRYHFHWDRFSNGIMITCELFYFLNRQKKIVHRETQFVESKDIHYAKNVICESLLHNIGLGFTISDSEEYNLSSESEENSSFSFDEDDVENIIKEELQSGMSSTLNKVMEQTGHTIQDMITDTTDENTKEMGKMLSSLMSGQEPDKETMERLTQNIFNSIMQKQ
jgi:hypothetical protein